MNIFEEILKDELIIETERLRIYPFIINNKVLWDLYYIYSSSSNVKHYCKEHNNFLAFCDYMKNKIQEHQNYNNGIISYLIELKENSKIIGVRNVILDGIYTKSGNENINNENLITEILINQEYWQTGIAWESSCAIFEFLKSKGIKNVLSFVNNNNDKAKKLDDKLGFQLIDVQKAELEFNFHKDFVIHTTNIDECDILLKVL